MKSPICALSAHFLCSTSTPRDVTGHNIDSVTSFHCMTRRRDIVVTQASLVLPSLHVNTHFLPPSTHTHTHAQRKFQPFCFFPLLYASLHPFPRSANLTRLTSAPRAAYPARGNGRRLVFPIHISPRAPPVLDFQVEKCSRVWSRYSPTIDIGQIGATHEKCDVPCTSATVVKVCMPQWRISDFARLLFSFLFFCFCA